MRSSPSLAAAALGLLALFGCTDSAYRRPASSETTTVVRDAYGNPLSSSTTVRDANGNLVATSPSTAPVYSGSTVYPTAPVYSNRNCVATPLHQDRPGGSDYNPYRGAPSC